MTGDDLTLDAARDEAGRALGRPPTDAELAVALERTRADLAATAAASVPPMSPADVDRLMAALPTGAIPATVVPLGPRRRLPRWLPAAAAVVLVAGGAVGASVLLRDGGGSAATGSSAPASAAVPGAASARTRVLVSGRDYTPAEVRRLAANASAERLAASDGAVPPALASLQDGPQLAGCLSQLGSAPPLLLDYARYDGKPALVVVLPGQRGRTEVWVVGPQCSAAAPNLQFFAQTPAG